MGGYAKQDVAGYLGLGRRRRPSLMLPGVDYGEPELPYDLNDPGTLGEQARLVPKWRLGVPNPFAGLALPPAPKAPPAEQESPDNFGDSAFKRYMVLTQEPRPERPMLVEGEGRGAYRLGGKTYRPSRLDRVLAPALAALAQGAGTMSGEQAEQTLGDLFYGPYRRAMGGAQMAERERAVSLGELASTAGLQRGQREYFDTLGRASTMYEKRARKRPRGPRMFLGRPGRRGGVIGWV